MRKAIVLIALSTGFAGGALANFEGRVVSIHDGDTLTIRVDGRKIRIRLDGIDAPELAQPYGRSARSSLAHLCRGKNASVVDRGKDDEGRIIGSVRCGELDANAEQVRRGMAWVYCGICLSDRRSTNWKPTPGCAGWDCGAPACPSRHGNGESKPGEILGDQRDSHELRRRGTLRPRELSET